MVFNFEKFSWQLLNILLPEASPTIHMIMMAVRALLVVDLNLRGWHIAYQRSIEIDVSVMTDTVTETVYKFQKRKKKLFKINVITRQNFFLIFFIPNPRHDVYVYRTPTLRFCAHIKYLLSRMFVLRLFFLKRKVKRIVERNTIFFFFKLFQTVFDNKIQQKWFLVFFFFIMNKTQQ